MNGIAKSFLLLFFFSLCAAAMIVTHWAHAPAVAPRELYSVVNSQLADFRASDFAHAYRHSSSGVQQKFSLAQFENMIRRNYSTMTQTLRIEYGSVHVHGASAVVQVFFFPDNGKAEAFLYSMIAEDGSWKIEGVEAVPVSRPHPILAGLHV